MTTRFAPLLPDDPQVVAGYRLRARLGSGGMGNVYFSVTPGGRPIAIKMVRAEYATDQQFRRRFAQEVEAAQRVQSPYTAPLVDADPDGAIPWLATAYIPGPSLHQAVDDSGPLPVRTVLPLVSGIAEALSAIHLAGVVHRDLKPSNVLLAADRPKVIDFGIARAADATSLTATGVRIGTPAFMTPEQVRGLPVGPPTDVFALGLLTAFAATGRAPFGEGTTEALFYRILNEEPELTGLPETLRDLVRQCLEKDPAARPAPQEIVAATQTAGVQADWLPPSVTGTLPAFNPPHALLSSAPPTTPVSRAPFRKPLFVGVGIAAAVAAAITVKALSGGSSPHPHTDTPPTAVGTRPAQAPVPSTRPTLATPSPAITYDPVYKDVEITLPGGKCSDFSTVEDGIDFEATGPKVQANANGSAVFSCVNSAQPSLTVWDWTGNTGLVTTDAPDACVTAVNQRPLGHALAFSEMHPGTRLCILTNAGQIILMRLVSKQASDFTTTWSVTAWARPPS